MKIKKVYDEIIKASLNNEKAIIFLGKLEDKIAVSTDGFIMYFVPEKDFIFDIEKILRGRGRFKSLPSTNQRRNQSAKLVRWQSFWGKSPLKLAISGLMKSI